MIEVLQPVFISAAGCAVLVVLLSPIAQKLGLTDKTSISELHPDGIPIVGGIAIFLSASLAILLTIPTPQAIAPLAVGSILVLAGAIDDRFFLRVRTRLIVQVFAALGLIYIGGIGIGSVGNLTGNGAVELAGIASIIFTVVCTIGVINSINMIDGVDGLAGVIVALILVSLTYFCWIDGDAESVLLLLSFLAALLVFLYFNMRIFRNRAAVFMGDSGSMLFGLLIVWYFIRLTQGESPSLSPIAAGWIFGLPLLDTVSVMVVRMLTKRSPVASDRSHFHHQLLDAGFSTNQTVAVISLVHFGFVLVGIACNENRHLETVFFWLFVILVMLHHMLTPRILSLFKRSELNEVTK